MWGVCDAVIWQTVFRQGGRGAGPDVCEPGTSSKHIKRVLIFPLNMDNKYIQIVVYFIDLSMAVKCKSNQNCIII